MASGVASPLRNYLRAHTGDNGIDYAIPPRALTGGYDTATYEFRLSGAPEVLRGDLVLRLFPSRAEPDRARFEGIVQSALARQGYPAAPVHLQCVDPSVLGGAFIIMAKLPGAPLIELGEPDGSIIMGATHAELHELDPGPVRAALAEHGLPDAGLASRLDWLASRITATPWLDRAMQWVKDNAPDDEGRVAVCHGDFHKLNILTEGKRVSGVIDWSMFALMEPAFDVACTHISFTVIAPSLTAAGDFPPVDLGRVVNDYRRAYDARRELDATNMDYYLVLRSVLILMFATEGDNVFSNPVLVRSLCDLIDGCAAIRLKPPEWLLTAG